MALKIICGADHAGFLLKESLKKIMVHEGYEVFDCGTHEASKAVDYPDYALDVVTLLKRGEGDFGLLVCGSGIGMDIAANRHVGIRAALCHDVTAARLSRTHNNANILVLGERLIGPVTAEDCLKVFLKTPYEEKEKHQRRIEKLG